ncbi:hypothetical protein VIGAN_04343000, partial [Vigna angularis var. angularis]
VETRRITEGTLPFLLEAFSFILKEKFLSFWRSAENDGSRRCHAGSLAHRGVGRERLTKAATHMRKRKRFF